MGKRKGQGDGNRREENMKRGKGRGGKGLTPLIKFLNLPP